MRNFRLTDRVEIIDSLPALHIRDLDAVCIADLHLGYEGIMAEYYGTFLPKTQFNEEMEALERMVKSFSRLPKRIILNGDVKHEFSESTYHEYREVRDLLEFLSKHFEEIIVIKGNHDNFIALLTKRFEKVKLLDAYEDERYYIIHGHRAEKSLKFFQGKTLILAHEHPSIALYSAMGRKEKIPCFLVGREKNVKIIVMPCFSVLAQGSDINLIPKEELLSPVLKMFDIDNFEVVLVDREIGVKKLGKLKSVREATGIV